MKKLCIVTGANGHLGNTIIRQLERNEYEIWGLILPHEHGVFSYVHYIHGDICDIESIRPLFQHDENTQIDVIHTAGIIDINNKISPELYQVNVNGCKNILTLCKQYKVHRLLYVSSVHAIPPHKKDGLIYETNTFHEDQVKGGYAKTKAIATQMVLDACEQGLNAVVVHPSGIIGPYDNSHNHLVQMIQDYVNKKLPYGVKGGYDFVDVRDVATGCLLALQKGKTKNCYILSNQYYKIEELFSIIDTILLRKKKKMLSISFLKSIVPFYQLHAKRKKMRPLLTYYSLSTLSSNDRFSHEKATVQLGYTTRPLKETIQDTLSWLHHI